MKFLKRLCSLCRKIKYVPGSRFLCIQKSALFLFSLKTADSNFGKKIICVSWLSPFRRTKSLWEKRSESMIGGLIAWLV